MITLTNFEIFKGFSNIILVLILFIIGVKLALKYLKYKDETFLYMGISWILIIFPYLSTSISFLYTLTTGELLRFDLYITINMALFPVAVFLWLVGLTNIAFTNHEKKIRWIFAIYGIVFEITFCIFLFMDPTSLLGKMSPPFIPKFKPFIILNYGVMLIILIISGVLFSLNSLKSSVEKVRIKGKFLLSAFIFLIFGSFLDLIPTPDYIILFKRTSMILSGILFYLGFYLPNFLESWLLKE